MYPHLPSTSRNRGVPHKASLPVAQTVSTLGTVQQPQSMTSIEYHNAVFKEMLGKVKYGFDMELCKMGADVNTILLISSDFGSRARDIFQFHFPEMHACRPPMAYEVPLLKIKQGYSYRTNIAAPYFKKYASNILNNLVDGADFEFSKPVVSHIRLANLAEDFALKVHELVLSSCTEDSPVQMRRKLPPNNNLAYQQSSVTHPPLSKKRQRASEPTSLQHQAAIANNSKATTNSHHAVAPIQLHDDAVFTDDDASGFFLKGFDPDGFPFKNGT